MDKRVLIGSILIALLVCIQEVGFWTYLGMSAVVAALLIGIYHSARQILKHGWPVRIALALAIVVSLTVIVLIGALTTFSGFSSVGCWNLVGKNPLTGAVQVYCDHPPWYVSIVGGEEARAALLADCKGRHTPFYDEHPDYCDVYVNGTRDWTQGMNP